MKKGILISIIALLALGQSAFACSADGKDGFVEENNLWIGTEEKNQNMTEADFNTILDRVEKIYAPIISAKGKQLDVIRKWDDGTVNAYAQQTGNVWKISMFGGLARHATITQDAFAVVACHELGHHLGGYPKKSSWMGVTWASNEGQSDYFGTSKCIRKYFEEDDNQAVVANMDIPAVVTEKCETGFTNAEEVAMCKRNSMAGLSLGNLFRALRRMTTELKFTTPDPKVVASTDHNHPQPQCRLDTYFAGALCDKSAYTDVSDSDYAEGLCARVDGYSDGVRPKCWFKVPSN